MTEFHRPLPAMSLAVVGGRYANEDGSSRRFEIRLCTPNEPVELRPDPKNKHDPRAVAVYSCRGVQLGYVSAERCGRIGQLIRDGRELQAVFQAETDFGAWIRVAFDGEQPGVSPVEELPTLEENPDWYPDEIWPDE